MEKEERRKILNKKNMGLAAIILFAPGGFEFAGILAAKKGYDLAKRARDKLFRNSGSARSLYTDYPPNPELDLLEYHYRFRSRF